MWHEWKSMNMNGKTMNFISISKQHRILQDGGSAPWRFGGRLRRLRSTWHVHLGWTSKEQLANVGRIIRSARAVRVIRLLPGSPHRSLSRCGCGSCGFGGGGGCCCPWQPVASETEIAWPSRERSLDLTEASVVETPEDAEQDLCLALRSRRCFTRICLIWLIINGSLIC